jgi:hypothetical protein
VAARRRPGSSARAAAGSAGARTDLGVYSQHESYVEAP